MRQKSKPKYLINGFKFLYDSLSKVDNTREYTFAFPKPGKYDFITNYLLLKKLPLSDYDIIHINCWENFLQYKPTLQQISICHSHGIHIGLDKTIGINQSSGIIKIILRLGMGRIIRSKLQKAMKEFDLCYVAIPNALPYAKKIRSDAKWLPNPINIDLFKSVKTKKLKGINVLFPTRFHEVKNPDFAFEIFDAIKKRYPDAKIHLVSYPKRFSQTSKYSHLYTKYAKDIIFHKFMTREELPEFYSKFDIILGSFNTNYYYANLNLVELEAMACKVPVVTHDKYELIKKDINKLPELALKILEDSRFRKAYIDKCFNYVKKVHSEQAVYKLHAKNLIHVKRVKKT